VQFLASPGQEVRLPKRNWPLYPSMGMPGLAGRTQMQSGPGPKGPKFLALCGLCCQLLIDEVSLRAVTGTL